MSLSADFQQAFEAAGKLARNRDFAAAEQGFQGLLASGENREMVLRALLELYIHTQRPLKALEMLQELVLINPDSLVYTDRLAGMLSGLGQYGKAIACYREFLERQADNADAWFNLALIYKKAKRYGDAETAYEKAIGLDISGLDEVYSNLGVLYSEMRQPGKAMQMHDQALGNNADYIPALFNLAGCHEESGQRDEAQALYERILVLDPRHWESLSRLAYGKKMGTDDGALLERLQQATGQARDDALGRESLYFALGKSLDDLERYEEAFTVYTRANELGAKRQAPYNRGDVEQGFQQLMEAFSAERIRASSGDPAVTPVFICGMFRSGSSLVEQVLSGHSAITAGGELDFLQWLVAQNFNPFPQRAATATPEELHAVGYQYLSLLGSLFPDATVITDKKPDNFLYLGLVRMLYPAAKIIYTRRKALDNCLSIYFQQLGGNLRYATDLQNSLHYYQQHEQLMRHWQACFGENIFTVDYDELVKDAEPVLRNLLGFLELDWEPACLDFQRAENPVKTASVWQVREGLHTRSSGRWENYAAFLPQRALLEQQVGRQ